MSAMRTIEQRALRADPHVCSVLAFLLGAMGCSGTPLASPASHSGADAAVSDGPSGTGADVVAIAPDPPADAGPHCASSHAATSAQAVCDSQLARPTCFAWSYRGFPMNPAGIFFAQCAGGTSGFAGQAGSCVAADTCSNMSDPASCRCGDGPACAADESCIAPSSRDRPSCQCRPQEAQ